MCELQVPDQSGSPWSCARGRPSRGAEPEHLRSTQMWPTHNIFRGKKMAWGQFPSRGKAIHFPSSHKNSLFWNPSFQGKNWPLGGKGQAIFKGKLSLRGKIFPPRENAPNFPLGKILPQKMFRVHLSDLKGPRASFKAKKSKHSPCKAFFVTLRNKNSLARLFSEMVFEVVLDTFKGDLRISRRFFFF